jgi:HNH endonuclease
VFEAGDKGGFTESLWGGFGRKQQCYISTIIPKVGGADGILICMNCLACSKTLNRHQFKYCSNKCQHEQQYENYIAAWKLGNEDGNRGDKTKVLSRHLRRYLIAKNNEKCSQCGWSIRHTNTGFVPLEIDHIDGNAQNNHESNLRLLCPNCHSLTPHFRNLNRGHGRPWRK